MISSSSETKAPDVILFKQFPSKLKFCEDYQFPASGIDTIICGYNNKTSPKEVALFGINYSQPDYGLGLSSDPTGQNKIDQTGFIQIDTTQGLQKLIDLTDIGVDVKFMMGKNLTKFDVYGSNTKGKMNTSRVLFSGTQGMVWQSLPLSYDYITITTTSLDHGVFLVGLNITYYAHAPSTTPSLIPSVKPTFMPSISPTLIPSTTPSILPSISPTFVPSASPTISPSVSPTFIPSGVPSTSIPSITSTRSPSNANSSIITKNTLSPTGYGIVSGATTTSSSSSNLIIGVVVSCAIVLVIIGLYLYPNRQKYFNKFSLTSKDPGLREWIASDAGAKITLAPWIAKEIYTTKDLRSTVNNDKDRNSSRSTTLSSLSPVRKNQSKPSLSPLHEEYISSTAIKDVLTALQDSEILEQNKDFLNKNPEYEFGNTNPIKLHEHINKKSNIYNEMSSGMLFSTLNSPTVNSVNYHSSISNNLSKSNTTNTGTSNKYSNTANSTRDKDSDCSNKMQTIEEGQSQCGRKFSRTHCDDIQDIYHHY